MAKKSTTTKSTPRVVKQSTKRHSLNIKPIDEVEYSVIKYDNPDIVETMEKEWPEMTDEFKRIMFTQYELFCKKQANYGPDNISVGSDLKSRADKNIALTGLWFRMNDKIQRLKQMVVQGKKDEVGEAIEDSYQDLSVYGIIAQIVSNGKWAK
ncbi:MAG: hypothetical protein CMD32_07620 [Flavobacteriales bacterium]|jgi:hypothetical protein|nr:hypothetical protein [Flavobacteriales bacterium]